jgi:hydrogenase expression/formation protein HypC
VTALDRYATCTLADGRCAACADAGIPVRVLEVCGTVALCEDRAGERAEIAVDFVGGARPGDVLLVHAGVAIARAEEAPA